MWFLHPWSDPTLDSVTSPVLDWERQQAGHLCQFYKYIHHADLQGSACGISSGLLLVQAEGGLA